MISIKGIRIKSLSFERDNENNLKMSGSYDLMSSTDKVLAKQDFGGYNSIKLEQSPETAKSILETLKLVKEDLELQLGLRDEE